MNETDHEDGHFRMRSDETIEETPIAAGVNELRLEKINTRVTIISVIVPVLIVIILVFTYLDIKRRMEKTEDTGTMGVQKLSSDLESRFSSLSVRQARLEDDTVRMMANIVFLSSIEKSFARIEIKIKNLTDSMDSVKKSGASKTELKGKAAEFDKKVGNLSGSIEEVNTQLASLSQSLKSDLDQVAQGLTTNSSQLQNLEEKITALDKNKLEKPALDLALRLETLKIQESVQAELDSMQTQIKNLDQKVHKLSQQVEKNSQPPSASVAPTTPAPSPPSNPPAGTIEEQALPPSQ